MLDAEIRQATCQIKCGEDTGTGWLVSENKILTARHCVIEGIEEGADVFLTLEGNAESKDIKATIIDHDDELDACLLLIEKDLSTSPIVLSDTLPIAGSPFTSYGWPVQKLTIGHRLEGTISQLLDIPRLLMDVEVHITTSSSLTNYKGFSGAPLICDGVCFGLIRVALDNTVGAISIARLKDFLLKCNAFPELASDEESSGSNLASRESFTREFDHLVISQSGGYVFIDGAHGIGKSTFCETYTPVDSLLEHFETYSFTTKRHLVNTLQRAQPQEFLNWLNMQVSMHLTRSPGRVEKKDYPDLIKEAHGLLTRLGQEYKSRGKIGVLFIDGIDELEKLGSEFLQQFVGLLPLKVPEGLSIALSAPSYSRLAARLGTRLVEKSCITLPSLSNDATRELCRYELVANRSDPVTIKLISDRAQGHPLYLRYLIELVNGGAENEELADLPLIEGSIRNYYDALWNQLQEDQEAVNLLAIAVRLRWGILVEKFSEILNQSEKAVLIGTLTRINHLLLNPDETTIYHSSFADFLIEKTKLRDVDIQLRLFEYCETHRDTSYGLKNVIYHGLHSPSVDKQRVISLCNQIWADECANDGAEPDVLLEDINGVLAEVTALGNLVETVRVLLLTQRLQFRYNTLFAQSANLTANALISLGKTSEVLLHVIRYGQLIIPISEALKVAKKLIEVHNNSGALDLLEIIETSIDVELTSDSGISFSDFLPLYDLQIQQFMIRYQAGDHSARDELNRFMFLWLKAIDTTDPNKDFNKLVRNEMMTYMQAAMMCLSGRYLSIAEISQVYSGPRKELIQPCIYTASFYKDMCQYYEIPINKSLLVELFSDLENLLSEGSHDLEEIQLNTIGNLISLGAPPSIIRAICDEGRLQLTTVQFVDDDHVSINESFLYEGMTQWLIKAFLDSSFPCPELVSLSSSNWKEYVEIICKSLAWCDGAARRFKASDDDTNLGLVWAVILEKVFEPLKFNLSDRSEWEDAYALPEGLVPLIYNRLTALVVDIFPAHTSYLLNFLDEHFISQCGLYSEGFRSVLLSVLEPVTARSLGDDVEDQAFLLVDKWRSFVLRNVKNRHELIPELLMIIPLQVRLNAIDEAKNTYPLVLSYSMGPNWYKEDQFGLMVTALESLDSGTPTPPRIISKIAGLLDAASGEMTFQRFVRYAKRDLIGALCKRGDYRKATEFLIAQAYGSKETLFREASEGDMDRISPLRGGRYPGGALDEQDVIASVLSEEISVDDWPLCWALLEIYNFGDSRYLSNYVDLYLRLIKQSEGCDETISEMMKRLELIFESEIESTEKNKFLVRISNGLPSSLKDQFEKRFASSDFKSFEQGSLASGLADGLEFSSNENRSDDSTSNESLVLPGTFGTRESIGEANNDFSNAERKIRRRNYSDAKTEIMTGLEKIQSGGWSLWGGQLSEASNGMQLLLQMNTSASEIVSMYSSLVLNEKFAPRWLIASYLIETLGSNSTPEEQQELVNLSVEHTSIMIGSEESGIQNFLFLEELENSSASSCLIDIFKHALDHPTWLRREKAAEILLWMLRSHPKYIPIIGPYAFSMNSNIHPDIICGVLDQLSRSAPEALWGNLSPAIDIDKIKLDCQHAGRISTLINILARAASRGSDSAQEALTELKEIFPSTSQSSNDNEIICPAWAVGFDFQWRALQDLGLLDTEFVENATSIINEICNPFSLDEIQQIEKLLAQGYYESNPINARWEAKVRFALQVAALNAATESDLTKIDEIFRIHNPNRIDHLRITNFDSPGLSWLNQLKNNSGEIVPVRGRNIFLDFYERIWLDDGVRTIRITAYFYDKAAGLQPQRSGRFFSTEEITLSNTSYIDTCANVIALPAYLGSFTPAIPSEALMRITRAKNSDISRSYWRSGRLVESMGGAPRQEGCFLAIDVGALQLPPSIELIWIYELNGKPMGSITCS
jgi:hypothetical protein